MQRKATTAERLRQKGCRMALQANLYIGFFPRTISIGHHFPVKWRPADIHHSLGIYGRVIGLLCLLAVNCSLGSYFWLQVTPRDYGTHLRGCIEASVPWLWGHSRI
ncbi:hypothetical protein F5883DRAFT_540633 [Diaporthe sp. PMI_573]|nr:hypothetical protein F5883DRAFT_540633 [Diaporthaceae sp. PMI_573]